MVDKDIRKYIESGDFSALEEAWLERLAEAPRDIEFFVGVARSLKGAGETARASVLLQLVDDELVGGAHWPERLALARAAGDLLQPAADLHLTILDSLRRLHRGAPSLEDLIEFVGLHRAVEDLPRTWEKVDRLQALLGLDLGTVVWMKDKGAGRVVEVNFELESFKIDFERHPGLRVGFKAAPKLLEVLPPEHFLRRKLEAPAELAALKAKRPEELLLAVLSSATAPLTTAEIREALAGVVGAEEWGPWWTAARRSPRVLAAGSGARQRYRAAASDAEAGASIERAFHGGDLAGKLETFRRHAARDPTFAVTMGAELERLAAAAGEPDTETAFAVFYELAEAAGTPPAGPWTPPERLGRSLDPAGLVAGLADRVLRERGYDWIREHRTDAAEVLERALRLEPDPRLLEPLAAGLAELAPPRLAEFIDEVLVQPRRYAAAFVWLAEHAADDAALLRRSPLRLLQHLFASLRQDEFKPFRAKLRRLCESGPLLPRLLDVLDEGQAEAAAQAVERAPLEEYLRVPLANALTMRFPALRPPAAAALYALPTSIASRREELRRLREEEIPANRRAIEEARELGDLRENFEYKSARQRHEYLASRVAALETQLGLAQPIDLARQDHSEARIAARVRIGDDGTEREIVILGPWESDPERDIVSYDSELGQALLGKAVGDEAEFGGRRLTILAIESIRHESLP